jgi:hypothetical protein
MVFLILDNFTGSPWKNCPAMAQRTQKRDSVVFSPALLPELKS